MKKLLIIFLFFTAAGCNPKQRMLVNKTWVAQQIIEDGLIQTVPGSSNGMQFRFDADGKVSTASEHKMFDSWKFVGDSLQMKYPGADDYSAFFVERITPDELILSREKLKLIFKAK